MFLKSSLKNRLNLLCITCRRSDMTYAEQVELACIGGADMIQFRDKTLSDIEILKTAAELKKICLKYNVIFTVNNRADIAFFSEADGVHLGQKDLPAEYARRILGKDKIIGVSASFPEEVAAADKLDIDYIGHGAVFPTATKPDARQSGLGRLSEIRKITSKPLIAIGGINSTNVTEVIKAGADGVAVVGAVCGAKDIKKAAQDIKKLILKAKERN